MATGVPFCESRHDTYPEIDAATKSNLSGRAVFVTGASKGIGRCTAIAYAKAGASHIAIAARSSLSDVEADMIKAAKAAGKPEPKILKLELDVQNRDSINNNLKEIEAAFGRLDVLINNAGYLEPSLTITESDEDDYWKTWEVNYRGVYWVTKTFLPLLIKSTDGLQTIVNVSSIGALSSRVGGSSYQTTKHALLKFTEHICVEYGDTGVLAYSVHPGGVMTELASRMPPFTHSCKSASH
jgi:NAD(P)-dependent dehydrogenase (short-subunit alcohol dehydrogenase family)